MFSFATASLSAHEHTHSALLSQRHSASAVFATRSFGAKTRLSCRSSSASPLGITHSTTHPDTAALEAAIAKTLDATLKQKEDALAELERQVQHEREACANEVDAYLKTLCELLNALTTQLEHVRHKQHSQFHSVFVSYFAAVVSNIHKKLKCLELDVLHTVYHGCFGHSLANESQQLRSIQIETNKQIASLDRKLAAYNGAGAEFDDLLQLYLRITKDIKNLENDMAKMKMQ
ncbi:hypothetical protein BCR33DRAFT_723154 [Rhizoclosmatium globosum]|uniref:Uncharacterized protein n=1 Tax=Rhizoclosmatium globosum TaxID=329046 RepID=A0A1Y2BGG7_9FUNG|nr:hypothetical protein BCR33DRAFT_723154 [Rhizoclosmatium globosum]|eukprot:ORY33577.1 hypothetical protein BCR33DRAFT_723154 [Rhizoclosmatium globosum]